MRRVSPLWLAWGAIGIAFASSLTLPIVTLPGNSARLRRFQTPEVGPEHTFTQTFAMNHDGLSAIEVGIAALGSDPGGAIDFRLFDLTDRRNRRLVRTGALDAVTLAGKASCQFTFAPIDDSRRHTYKLEISGAAHSGFALVATKGDAYASGTLAVNDRGRWADLVFQTATSTPVGSRWMTLIARRGESAPELGGMILALLGLNWVAVGLLLYSFADPHAGAR